MNVGYFKNVVKKDDSGQEHRWIGGMINIPFMHPIECSLIPATDEELSKNQNAPVYKVALYKPKNWAGGRQIIGGIWNATSKDGKTNYFKGHIETPLAAGGRVYLALFKPKEDNGLMFEATWSAPKSNSNSYTPTQSDDYQGKYDEADVSQYCDDDDTIPF